MSSSARTAAATARQARSGSAISSSSAADAPPRPSALSLRSWSAVVSSGRSAGSVEVGCEAAHRAVVERELTAQVTACSEDEERPPDRSRQLVRIERHPLKCHERHHGRSFVRRGIAKVRIEMLEDLPVGVHASIGGGRLRRRRKRPPLVPSTEWWSPWAAGSAWSVSVPIPIRIADRASCRRRSCWRTRNRGARARARGGEGHPRC